uniref:NADAR domain-containing protein n=1 Tax=Alexandrium monilatum TaxID=311494 RepID=A0A7S4Q7T7_9DINO
MQVPAPVTVNKQSRAYDGSTGAELAGDGPLEAELLASFVVVSGKARAVQATQAMATQACEFRCCLRRGRLEDTQSNGYLSNWATSPFELDGVRYASAEQWIMASKARACGDEATLGAIMQSRSPRKQKALGRSLDPKKVSRFWTLQAKWEAQLRGARGKFQQNEALALRLLKTGQKPIAEASPSDRIFGIGLAPNDPLAQDTANWKRGHNLLGKALAQVRDELRASVLAQPPDFQGDLQLLLATAEPPAPPEANPAAGQLVQEEDLLSDPGSDGGVEEPSESESEPPGGGDLT